jgi:hypothetical protein
MRPLKFHTSPTLKAAKLKKGKINPKPQKRVLNELDHLQASRLEKKPVTLAKLKFMEDK